MALFLFGAPLQASWLRVGRWYLEAVWSTRLGTLISELSPATCCLKRCIFLIGKQPLWKVLLDKHCRVVLGSLSNSELQALLQFAWHDHCWRGCPSLLLLAGLMATSWALIWVPLFGQIWGHLPGTLISELSPVTCCLKRCILLIRKQPPITLVFGDCIVPARPCWWRCSCLGLLCRPHGCELGADIWRPFGAPCLEPLFLSSHQPRAA